MDNDSYNLQILEVAELMTKDHLSLDEQDPQKLQKYYDYAQNKFHVSDDDSIQMINETFFYLKLKNAKDVDPLQDGDKFGAGFS